MSRTTGVALRWLIFLSALVLALALPASAFAAPAASFDGPMWYDTHYYLGTSYYAYSHQVADLNNDGHPDLVVPMYDGEPGEGYLRTYLNDGSGSFTESDVTTISGPYVEVADLDRDGNSDVVVNTVWGTSGHAITIAKGDGAGGLDVVGYLDPGYVSYFHVADFNGDTIPDILVGTGNFDDVAVYLGNGDFTYTLSAVVTGIGYNSWSATSGDVNRDGKLDFLVANYGSNTIDIRLGDGTGAGFAALPDLPTLSGPARPILADFDRDGILDLACNYSGGSSISVWHGDGTGDFVNRRDYTFTYRVNDLQAADVNLDGTPDLVVGGQRGDDQSDVMVLLNDGRGDFPVRAQPSYGAYWAYGLDAVRVADFDGDGRPDLSTTHVNNNFGSNVVFLWNASTIDHSLDLHVSSVSTGRANNTIATGDFNRDGITDLAVGPNGASETYILTGDGRGSIATTLGVGGQSNGGISVADVNRDGKLDLLSFYTGMVSTSLGDGSGSFGLAAMGSAVGAFAGTAIDEDRDGLADLFAAGNSEDYGQLFRSTGTGGLVMVNVVGGFGPSVQEVTSADLDGDGRPDLAGVSSAGTLSLAYGQGDTYFSNDSTTLPGVPAGIAAGDINGDGKTDLVAACFFSGLKPLINEGGRAFTPGSLTASADVYDVALTDFDLDGVLEAVTAGRDGYVRYFDNDGDGAFTEVASIDPSGAGAALTRLAVLDLDRNGHPDVAATCDDGNVYLIGNDVTAPYTTMVSSPWTADGANGWYVTTPTVMLQTNEPVDYTRYTLNGSDWADYPGSIFDPVLPGTNTASFWSIDAYGNQEDTVTATFKVDTGKPVTTISGLPAGVSTTPETFTLDATDTVSGVARTYYTLNGGATQTYAGPVGISTDGLTTIAYWSVDNAGNIESSQSTDVVLDLPDPPVTAPDEYTTDEDTTLTVLAPGVLGNDYDPMVPLGMPSGVRPLYVDPAMTACVDTTPTHGTLELASDGGFVYVPDANWNGTDTFTYIATNAYLSASPETVTIDVTSVPDAPTALSLSNDTIDENQPAGTAVGTLGATDVDSTEFTYSLVGGDTSAFAISGDELQTAEAFDYETKSSYSVTVRVTDESGGTFDQAFTIVVADVAEPPITMSDSYGTDEDTTLTVPAPGVLGNDTDPLPGFFLASIRPQIPALGMYATKMSDPDMGTLAFNNDGSFTYTPDADRNGTVEFTYVATNAEGSSGIETVTIDVQAVNDAPTGLSLSDRAIDENQPADTLIGTFSATDVDSSSFTYSLVGGDTSAFSIVGDELRSAKAFDYETKASYTITVRVDDGAGGTYDNEFTITVNDVNEPPAAANDSYETTEGITLDVPAPGVLANDGPDPEGDDFIAIDDSPASHGTYTLNSDGSFTYTPDAGFVGTDTFGYRAMDMGETSSYATVTITVNPADADPPVTTSDAKASYKGEAVITLSATDTVSGVAATYSKLDGGAVVEGTSIHVVTTGAHTLEFWSVDNADNVEATKVATFTVSSDIIPIQGDDRYGTAIRTSQAAFPEGSDYAVICRGNLWADVSGGSALAGAVDSPLLLTLTDRLPDGLEAELERLGANHVFILGDTNAISSGVETQLRSIVGSEGVERIGGYDRYDTARKVAVRTYELLYQREAYHGEVFLATGEDFPDAIAAAPLATRLHMPIVLTRKASLSTEASEALAAIGARNVHILGDTNAVSALVESQTAGIAGVEGTSRLAGPDRYRTAIAVATYGVSEGLSWNGLAIGTGTRFPDALAGGVMQGHFNSIVLLTRPDVLNPYTAEVLRAHKTEIGFVRILGGPTAVSEDVRVQVNDALN